MLIELQGSKSGRGISLTPLIDIVFILLIFFILESDFLELRELGVNLPESKTMEKVAGGVLRVEISVTGDLWINGLNMTQHQLGQYLQKKAFSPETQVLLITDPDVRLQAVVTSIDTLGQYSLTRVQIRSQGASE